jgi:hypothetical protein
LQEQSSERRGVGRWKERHAAVEGEERNVVSRKIGQPEGTTDQPEQEFATNLVILRASQRQEHCALTGQ